jgi:glycosyltransferase involved in cell wall biosynthesis
MPFVSVIVPAYNAEATLLTTVNDILSQTYRDFELVIVDDGSKDRTPEICDSLTDSRVRVLHQKNGGLSNARNEGTKFAEGNFVLYVDSDDRVEPYCLEFLVKALESTGADMACGGVDRVREDYQLKPHKAEPTIEALGTEEAIGEMLTERKVHIGTWSRLIPREWVLEEPFLEGKYYEDLSSTYRVNLKARKIAVVHEVLYHYVMRPGSITSRKTTSVKQCADYYEAVNLCARGCVKAFPKLKRDAAVLIGRDYMSLWLHIRRCPDRGNELDRIEHKVLAWLKKNWKIAASNNKAPGNVRLRLILFGISPWLYEKSYYVGIKFTGKKIG